MEKDVCLKELGFFYTILNCVLLMYDIIFNYCLTQSTLHWNHSLCVPQKMNFKANIIILITEVMLVILYLFYNLVVLFN